MKTLEEIFYIGMLIFIGLFIFGIITLIFLFSKYLWSLI